VEVLLYTLLISAIDGREVSVMSQLLYPWEKSSQHLLDRRVVEPEANMGTVEKGKMSAPCWELKSDYLVMKCLALSLY
jgi:hypothetical protein